MNVLIIDDDISFSEKFSKDISKFLHKFNNDIKIKVYNSNFLNINLNNNFRLAFVDIDLKETNGISFTNKIKKHNPSCDIIFISAKNNLIHSSLAVQPFFFIRKTNYYDDLYVFYELIKKSLTDKSMIQVSYKLIKTIIPIHDIIYIESIQHVLNIHTSFKQHKDGRTLKEFSTLLPSNYFVQIHRAFIVNCKYVYSISRGEIVLSYRDTNTDSCIFVNLRISRSYQKKFEEKYQEYLLL